MRETATSSLQATGGGDVAAASAVRECESMLRALAMKLCRNPADAEDLLHDTLERGLLHPDRLHSQDAARAWLCRVMHNLFVDRCRVRKRRPTTELDEAVTMAAHRREPEPAWAHYTPDDLRRAVERLPRKFRDVFVLHSFDGMRYEDIAAQLHIPRATVGTRLNRARAKLRVLLDATGERT